MQRLECRQPAHARPTVLLSPHAPIAPCKLCTRKNTVFCNSVAEHAVQAVTTHVPQIAVPAAAAIAVLVGPAVVEAVAAELVSAAVMLLEFTFHISTEAHQDVSAIAATQEVQGLSRHWLPHLQPMPRTWETGKASVEISKQHSNHHGAYG